MMQFEKGKEQPRWIPHTNLLQRRQEQQDKHKSKEKPIVIK
jgi:hypothetical protein